ncbi:MAG: GGDEF domain-containing protein [Proteobacteria bacterium]|nr:GGDEF domain-containing protein [Pseudomonadota bacterium]MBU1058983.1 GGDEF domain-containing protein [Pseudomonadota bacterium]
MVLTAATAGIVKKILGFFLPGGLVFITALLCIQRGLVDPWLTHIEKFAPYLILGVGFLLGWRFHRSRLAFVILLLTLADRILYYFGPGGVTGFQSGKEVFQATAILLPVNLALFYLVKERGIFNLQGLMKLLFILAQPLAVYLLLLKQPQIMRYLSYNFINHPLLDKGNLPQAILFTYAAAILLFMIGSLVSPKPIVRGFFWSLLATAAALHGMNGVPGAAIFFSVAGFIIILSVIETAYAMAYHDELTGLPARRSLNTTMQSLGRHFTIAMLDIDFFKKFNDRYGHDVGDQVLCLVASHISRVGGGGKPFRYGGEEFTVVFPGKSKKEVIPHLENLRESIARAKFGLRGKNRPKKRPNKRTKTTSPKTVSVTISIGAAEPGPHYNKPAEVIKAADKALYRAKKKGRNCVAT